MERAMAKSKATVADVVAAGENVLDAARAAFAARQNRLDALLEEMDELGLEAMEQARATLEALKARALVWGEKIDELVTAASAAMETMFEVPAKTEEKKPKAKAKKAKPKVEEPAAPVEEWPGMQAFKSEDAAEGDDDPITDEQVVAAADVAGMTVMDYPWVDGEKFPIDSDNKVEARLGVFATVGGYEDPMGVLFAPCGIALEGTMIDAVNVCSILGVPFDLVSVPLGELAAF